MYKKIVSHLIIICFLLPSFAWSQTGEDPATTQEIPQNIKDCKIDGKDLGALTVELSEYIVKNCNKGQQETTTTDTNGNQVVTWENVLYELNKDTNELTVTRSSGSKISGNLGESFPNNIALPIKSNQNQIKSITDITPANYSTVLGNEVRKLIDNYKQKLKDGYTVNTISISSSADKLWPTLSIPRGHTKDQVLNSYSLNQSKFNELHGAMGTGAKDHHFVKNQAMANEYNKILATNRGENIKILLKKLVFSQMTSEFQASLKDKNLDNWLSNNVKVTPKINQDQRRVDLEDNWVKSNEEETETYEFTPQEKEVVEETTIKCEDTCSKESKKFKKKKCIRTCCKDDCLKQFPEDNQKKEYRKCKRQCGKSLLSKILIGVGIGAGVGAAAWGISSLVKNRNQSSSTSNSYTPPVDNSINGWKFISASKTCIPFKFHPSKLDNVLYFKDESECLTKLSAPTSSPQTNSSCGSRANSPGSGSCGSNASSNSIHQNAPSEIAEESSNDSRDATEDDQEIDNLSDAQVLQQANSGNAEMTTIDPGYCTNQKYKILDDCYMTGHNHMRQKDPNVTPHPNYKVRSKKGVVKLFMKKILVCQYVENRAKYTIILDRDCRNGNL